MNVKLYEKFTAIGAVAIVGIVAINTLSLKLNPIISNVLLGIAFSGLAGGVVLECQDVRKINSTRNLKK